MQRTAFSLSIALSAILALALLVGIVPLLRGGDNYELTVKSALLVLVGGYAWLHWRALTRRGRCLLKTALCFNALVLVPLGATAALCHVFGGPKIVPREAGAIGGAIAILAAATAAMQVILLARCRTIELTVPQGD